MSFLRELEWRGLLFDSTPNLDEHLAAGPVSAYAGFDPTADSLHVGSLVPLIGLARLQRAGHRPIALVGGGTGLIGDPSGKRAERQLLTREQLAVNVAGIREQMAAFLDFDGPHAARLLDNADWLTTIPLTDFLRDVGKHFSIGYMTAKESVRSRLDSEVGLSFTEFSYQLLQAYDYLVLHDREGVTLQIGGSDQWGNITAGTELIRRTRGTGAHGLVFPLVTNASGSKFGKTEAGTVWLDPVRTSPYRFYQFWLNTDDQDVVTYLKYFTWLTREEIDALATEVAERPHQREAQRTLARAVTAMVHGEDALAAAERATAVLFSGNVMDLSVTELTEVFEDAPSVELPEAEFEGEGLGLLDLLVRAGLAASNGEARRLIRGGGVYVNGERAEDEAGRVTRADALGGELLVLRKGRKAYTLIRLLG